MARLFSSDPVTRTKRFFHYDESDDSVVIETVQDVEEILVYTTAQYNAFPHGESKKFKGEPFGHHMGVIPMPVLFDIVRICGPDEAAVTKAVEIWMNAPENRRYRTRPGRL